MNGKEIVKFASISFLIRISTVSGSARADWRMGQMRVSEGEISHTGVKAV